ncbi:NAD(P)/FAD-dependent oxidoreductase [Xanthomonas graminis]|uniref:Oxidoreductase n=1 Tax=Xanthomonas graminis pv. phlei TaxID=487906 RepID=A0A0K2ZGW9_9XANT|nr:FAD-dependent monooxygenase [Xanthomonas translucens]UKE64519.1 FAD-dependent monooxygenase [Xanthomonas translucens pv. phlei]CTP84986.1 oxidoreductase [Xanthomonas translucens pv. phlei]
MHAHCDVAVIGAGPAGCAAAIALRRAGVDDVVLVDAGDGRRPRYGESLPPATGLLLRALGIADAFAALDACRCVGSASSWGADTLGYNDFLFDPHGSGWQVDRQHFDAFLLHQARNSGARVRLLARLESAADAGTDGLRLQLRSDAAALDTLHARFVVDASGQRARLAQAMGAERVTGDRLVCLAALLPLDAESPLGQRSLLEAVDYGWWYAARLTPGEAIVVLATDASILREQRLQQPSRWTSRLAQTRHIAASVCLQRKAPQRLLARQARSSRLSRCGGSRWLAIGDAACSYDPLSAQGVHKALADAVAAAPRICAVLDRHEDAAVIEQAQQMLTRFDGYQRIREHFYRQETRWLDAPFWRRRHAAQATAATHPEHFLKERSA